MSDVNLTCPHCGAAVVRGPSTCPSCGRSLHSAPGVQAGAAATPKPPPARVVVVDFDMPMGSMVNFIFKWAIASIPAVLLLAVVVFIATAILAGIGAAIAGS